MINDLMWLKEPNILMIDDDLGEFLLENSFDNETTLDKATFIEFWELVLEWQKEVQK